MPRDPHGRFVRAAPGPAGAAPGLLTEATGQQLVRLLERLVYNTAQTHLTFADYLRKRVYADHPAPD